MPSFNLPVEWRHIGFWPRWFKVLIFLIGFGVSFFGMVVFCKLNVDASQDTLIQQDQKLSQHTQMLQQQIDTLHTHQNKLKDRELVFQTLLTQLQKTDTMTQWIAAVGNVAENNGIQVVNLTPLTPILHEFYREVPIDMTLTGSYAQLSAFVSSLTQVSGFLVPGDFKVIPNKKIPRTLTLYLRVLLIQSLNESEHVSANS